MALLVLFCLGIGFVSGVLVHQGWKKKTEQPEFMKWAAMRHLEKLQLSPEQRPKLEARVNAAVDELTQYRKEAMQTVWEAIDKASTGFEEDLTADQKEQWSKIRPRRPAELAR